MMKRITINERTLVELSFDGVTDVFFLLPSVVYGKLTSDTMDRHLWSVRFLMFSFNVTVFKFKKL